MPQSPCSAYLTAAKLYAGGKVMQEAGACRLPTGLQLLDKLNGGSEAWFDQLAAAILAASAFAGVGMASRVVQQQE